MFTCVLVVVRRQPPVSLIHMEVTARLAGLPGWDYKHVLPCVAFYVSSECLSALHACKTYTLPAELPLQIRKLCLLLQTWAL